MSFRRIIQTEAKRQKLTGYGIAKAAGLPMRAVQAFLAGDIDMTSERLTKVASVLGLTLQPKRQRRAKGRS